MPIMRAPSNTKTTFKIPCSGEGVFVCTNLRLSSGFVIYWNGTNYTTLAYSQLSIDSIAVQDGIATVVVDNSSGSNDEYNRVCFIPGDPLASN